MHGGLHLSQARSKCRATAERPQLSIVVASFNAKRTIEACLESLTRQITDKMYEIIVVDSSTDGTAGIVDEKFPGVKLQRFPERKFPGDARNRGLSVALADVVAFVDADCTVGEGWVEEVLKAHRRPYLLVGGIIDNRSRNDLVDWAYYFCEFNLWLPRSSEREIREIAGCCLSMKRVAFEKYGPFLEGTYCSDTAFQWRLARDKHKVLFVPAVRIFHASVFRIRTFLEHIVEHRRCFAEVSIQERKLSRWRKILWTSSLPVLPFVLFVCVSCRVFAARAYILQFLMASPLVFLGLAVRAWGECLGYAGVRGGSKPGAILRRDNRRAAPVWHSSQCLDNGVAPDDVEKGDQS